MSDITQRQHFLLPALSLSHTLSRRQQFTPNCLTIYDLKRNLSIQSWKLQVNKVMVILVDNQPLSLEEVQNLDSLYERHPQLLKGANQLASTKKRIVKPEGVLYARQKVNTVGTRNNRIR